MRLAPIRRSWRSGMTRPTLIVFARAPAIGVGKSRLARDVGRVEAWRLGRGFAQGTLRRLCDPRWRTVVRLTPDRGQAPPDWPRSLLEPQGRGGLGERLQRAIRVHAGSAVAVVGTDAPELKVRDVASAFQAARGGGAAIGPARDGGFWILALGPRHARRVALPGVRWSTAYTLADTERALGGPVRRLRTLVDVDDASSLAEWRARRRG